MYLAHPLPQNCRQMQLHETRRGNRRNPNNTPPQALSDRDLHDRSEGTTKQPLDARLIAGESVVSESFDTARAYFADQKSVLLPIIKKLARWTFVQLGTLSRVSARPAERAKLASAYGIRRQPMLVRVALVPLASLFIGLGVALQVTSGLGVGPGDMVASGISAQTGLSFGSSAILMSGLLALAGTLLGRPPKIATLVNVGMIAVVIDLLLPLLEIEAGVLARFLHFAGGLWAVGIGIGCLLHARLGIGTHEALSMAISDHTGLQVRKVRRVQELSWIALGVSLGSQFGVGTVLVALFIAPAIGSGTRSVGRVLTSLSQAVEAPEVAAHVSEVGF